VILIDLSRIDYKNPGKDYQTILNEFENYNPHLLKKPQIIALNKVDLLSGKKLPAELESYYQKFRIPFVAISAQTGEGIDSLLNLIRNTMSI
jgi:GTP-binding protein